MDTTVGVPEANKERAVYGSARTTNDNRLFQQATYNCHGLVRRKTRSGQGVEANKTLVSKTQASLS